MKKRTGILLATIWLSACHAQVRFNNLGDLLHYAETSSLVSRQSRLQNQISQRDRTISKSSTLPKINLFGTSEYDPVIPSLVVPAAAFGGNSDKYQRVQLGLPLIFSTGAELSLPVLNFEKWEALKRFRMQTAQTALSSQVNRENLYIQLSQWYYQALLTRELVRLSRANLDITDELLSVYESRMKNGVMDPAEYNRGRNLQLDVKTSVVQYDQKYRQSLIVLRQLLDLPDSSSIELADSLAHIDMATFSEETPVTGRPAYREAEIKKDIAWQQVRESKKSPLPVISLDGKYTYEWQVQPLSGQHINFDFSSIGLRLDFPLFQGSFYRANREKTALNWELAKLSEKQTINDLARQQAEWREDYAASLHKNPLLEEKCRVTADNLRIARLSVGEGVMEFEQFNSIFQEYSRAKMDYLQNLNDGIVYQLLLTQKW
jgi:outer membrane protein TolC